MIDQMLDNHEADTLADARTVAEFDDPNISALYRLEAYVDHCFETYEVLADSALEREAVQCCIANWDRRRGQCKYNAKMDKRRFNKRVSDSAHRNRVDGNYAVFLSRPLVGVSPENDRGCGWKACTHHELGHAIDYEARGTSDHGPQFKAVMRQFGHDGNDGQHAHGYAPSVHR